MMTSDWLLFALNTLVLLVVALGLATVSLRWIRSETSEVAVRLEKLEALLRELAGSTDSLGSRIEGVQAALGKDVAGATDALGTRIEGVKTALEKDVAGVTGALGPRIEGVKTALEKNAADASEDLASGVAEVKTELGNVEVRLHASVDGATDALSSRIEDAGTVPKHVLPEVRKDPESRPGQEATDIREDGPTPPSNETKADSQGEGPRKRRNKSTKTPARAMSIGQGAD